tara:strand:- start:14043 stop:14264 length:222 start_codon:yes stop_codon:yes gene_type:complete
MDKKTVNLQSTVNNVGEFVTQVIHFVGGVKRTYTGIKPETIKQGQFTKLFCKDGSMLMVNDTNVLCIEVFNEN